MLTDGLIEQATRRVVNVVHINLLKVYESFVVQREQREITCIEQPHIIEIQRIGIGLREGRKFLCRQNPLRQNAGIDQFANLRTDQIKRLQQRGIAVGNRRFCLFELPEPFGHLLQIGVGVSLQADPIERLLAGHFRRRSGVNFSLSDTGSEDEAQRQDGEVVLQMHFGLLEIPGG